MRTTFFSLISLFISCFIFFLGHGLINVLLPVRMALDGVSTDTIGMVLSLYFVGMLLGALYSKTLIKRAGHIRMFAGCVAMGAVTILICSLYADPALWGVMRVFLGFCNACSLTAMESWLSGSSSKETRGKVLGAYNAVMLGGLFGGQFFMNVASPEGTILFVVGGILFCVAIIPMVLSRLTGPVVEEVSSMSLPALYKISPLGVVSCLVSGLIYAALFNMLPVFAKDYGIVEFQLSLYMGAAILGAFVLQFPVGYLSDRFDRRTVLLCLLIISAVVGLSVTVLAPMGIHWAMYAATGITSGIIACTYPLSISESFDKLRQSEMVAAMGSLIMAFALGGMLGPYSASLVMNIFGNSALFYFLAVIQLLLAGFVMYRMTVRQALPVEEQESFVMQGAGLTSAVDLDPRTEYVEQDMPLSAEAETAVTIAATDPAAAVKMARAIAMANTERGVEVAAAIAQVQGIDVLRLYEVMKEAMPYQILDVTRTIVKAKPELAYELVKKLAEWHPMQVVPVAAEIGRTFPDLRMEMARVAAESAPESAVQVAEYYAQVLAEEREAVRPADREDDTSEEDALNIVSELWQAAPEQALDMAVAMVDAIPETAVQVAEEYIASVGVTEEEGKAKAQAGSEMALAELEKLYAGQFKARAVESPEDDYQDTIELVSRLAEVAPEQALDMAVAVVEAVPGCAAEVAAEMASNIAESESDEGDVTAVSDDESEAESLEHEAAVELVQRLTEASPESAMDVAVAVVEAVPECAVEVAAEYASNISDNGEEASAATLSEAVSATGEFVEAPEHEEAVELVQRLSEASPENAMDVAVAVVEAVPESAAEVAAEYASNISDNGEEASAATLSEAVSANGVYVEALEHEEAVELVQRLSEASPENAMDVAVAVVEAVPESAAEVAAEYASNISDSETGEEASAATLSEAVSADGEFVEAPEHEEAVELVQRLSEASPENAMDVAVAVVEAVPESAAEVAAEYASNISDNGEEASAATLSEAVSANGVYVEALEHEEAVELVQRLSEASPENAMDVAVAVVEAVPECAVEVAAEYASSISDYETGEEASAAASADADSADGEVAEAVEHDEAVELVQRLSEASPDNAMDVAVAVVEAIPGSASDVVDAISKGDESKEGEWVNSVDGKPVV
ncbi:MAG: MFS transporter [Amphritea sp.]